MNRFIPMLPMRHAWRALALRGLMLACVVPLVLQSAAQTSQKAKRQKETTYSAKRKALLKHGAEALAKEKALEHGEQCDVPEAFRVCLMNRLELVNQNYAAYIAAIEGLLEGAEYGRDALKGTPEAGQELKAAEALWASSVARQCNAAGDRYWGGTLRPVVILDCRVKLTQQHLQYLADFYGDLWDDEP